MNCPNHPNAPALRVCIECGGNFCSRCAPLKHGKVICKTCKEDLAYIKEKEAEREDGKFVPKGKEIKTDRISKLLKKAQDKVTHLSKVRTCGFHKDVEAVAACSRCKKNLCEKCISFEDKDDLLCPECWKKIPLSLRLSRKTKGRW